MHALTDATDTPATGPGIKRTITAQADPITLAHLRAIVAECDGLSGALPVFGSVGYSDLYVEKTVSELIVTTSPKRSYCWASGCLDRADQVVDYRPYCDEHAPSVRPCCGGRRHHADDCADGPTVDEVIAAVTE